MTSRHVRLSSSKRKRMTNSQTRLSYVNRRMMAISQTRFPFLNVVVDVSVRVILSGLDCLFGRV